MNKVKQLLWGWGLCVCVCACVCVVRKVNSMIFAALFAGRQAVVLCDRFRTSNYHALKYKIRSQVSWQPNLTQQQQKWENIEEVHPVWHSQLGFLWPISPDLALLPLLPSFPLVCKLRHFTELNSRL